MQSGEKTALERLYLPVTSRQYGAPRTEGDRQYLPESGESRFGMQQMIDKITERLEQTIHDIIYWKTPKHGYRSREEMESDKRYQELINTKFLLENDKIHPENDIRALGDGKMEIRYRWFYEKYFPEEMAELAAH